MIKFNRYHMNLKLKFNLNRHIKNFTLNKNNSQSSKFGLKNIIKNKYPGNQTNYPGFRVFKILPKLLHTRVPSTRSKQH